MSKPEKIEGFYDVCAISELTKTQGVIIPKANVSDLMLREDIIQAREKDLFQIYAVETIHEALEILTGHPCGKLGPEDKYPKGTILCRAAEKAFEYWEIVSPKNGEQG